MTQLTLVGDKDTTPPLKRKRRKRRQSPPTSPIREESDSEEDEVDMDGLLDEIRLDDVCSDKEESKVEGKERSPEARTVIVEATVHSQGDTS